jgi:alanyl-tRNA synthetase
MTSRELRKKFLEFFEKKGHQIVPSSSLIPEDKTVLLTSAGMQQFIPYLSGEKDVVKDFGKRELCSVQKCFRTVDIDNIGDDTHHTFFEMLGNWSIGKGYFKERAIELALDFFVNELGLDKNRFYVTVFEGEGDIPKDKEAIEIWKKNGIDKIAEFSSKDNFWGPTSQTGPCGPCSEIHYDRGEEYGCKDCGPNCEKCKRYVELWNLVFMEYNKKADGSYEKLPQSNVDTGIGFERLISLLNGKDSAYETDLFVPFIEKLESICGKKYEDNKKNFRIIVDHIRASVFLIADNVLPSNVLQGYVLRRLLRRTIVIGRSFESNFLIDLAKEVIKEYKDIYPELESENILDVIEKEKEKFEKTLDVGIRDTVSIVTDSEFNGAKAYNWYSTSGVPIDIIKEIAEEKGIILSKFFEIDFDKEREKHREISKAGAQAKFGGVGERDNHESAKLHTATHLLQQALRNVLGGHVQQMGSDITPQRLRFDFSHPAKLTEEQIRMIEGIVNEKIKENLEVKKEEMSYKNAIKSGAMAFFKEKYPIIVSVYSIGDFSKEICAGPHVEKTSELGTFKIIKEESSSSGVRRIRAVLE